MSWSSQVGLGPFPRTGCVLHAAGDTIAPNDARSLDALIVRSIIVPGLMLMLGQANWWLPRRLDRVLPHLNVEGDVSDGPAPDPQPAEPPRDLIPAPSAA